MRALCRNLNRRSDEEIQAPRSRFGALSVNVNQNPFCSCASLRRRTEFGQSVALDLGLHLGQRSVFEHAGHDQ